MDNADDAMVRLFGEINTLAQILCENEHFFNVFITRYLINNTMRSSLIMHGIQGTWGRAFKIGPWMLLIQKTLA